MDQTSQTRVNIYIYDIRMIYPVCDRMYLSVFNSQTHVICNHIHMHVIGIFFSCLFSEFTVELSLLLSSTTVYRSRIASSSTGYVTVQLSPAVNPAGRSACSQLSFSLFHHIAHIHKVNTKICWTMANYFL